MPATFPNAVRVYTTKTDLVDTVLAEHVNLLQDEVTAVQSTLGTGLLASTWSGTYSSATSHATLTARLANIEAGITSLFSTPASLVVANPRTSSYALVLSDSGKMVEMGSGSAQTLTVPPNSSVPFPVGTKIDVVQTGAGEVSVAPGSGVTIDSVGSRRKIAARWQAASLIQRAPNSWLLIGALKA